MGKPEGKRALGKPRRSYEDNIKIDFVEIEWNGGVDWIDLFAGEGQVAGSCECGDEPLCCMKYREFLD